MAVDCLWYIDGAPWYTTEALLSNSFSIACFVGYNTPELFKHRKRQVTNMSSALLSTLASSLFQNLQGSFWSHASLQRLYQQTRSLAQSLAGYADYLSPQNKIMKDLHARSNSMRQLSDSMSVKYIEPCRGVPIGRLDPCLAAYKRGRMVNTLYWMSSPQISPDRYEFIHSLLGEKWIACTNHASNLLLLWLEICTLSGNCYPLNHWKRPFKTVLRW